MQPEKLIGNARRVMQATVRPLTWIAVGVLVILVLLIVAHVFGRYFFKHPLPGTIEGVELLLAFLVFLVLAYTEVKRGHVRVELVISRFPRRAQAIIGSIMSFLGAALFFILAWQGWGRMWHELSPPMRVSNILSIPYFPFFLVIALGSFLLGLAMLIHCFYPLPHEEEEGIERGAN